MAFSEPSLTLKTDIIYTKILLDGENSGNIFHGKYKFTHMKLFVLYFACFVFRFTNPTEKTLHFPIFFLFLRVSVFFFHKKMADTRITSHNLRKECYWELLN